MPRLRHPMDVLSSAHRLAAVVPAWNEAESIGAVVSGLRQAGACCVLVVDPGSADTTRAAAMAAGATVVDEPRRGYGRACLTGTAAAVATGHEFVAFLDGDGSCDPSELPAMLAAAERSEADLVLGRRQSAERGALPWHARLGNLLVASMLIARTGTPVGDLPPFKLVRADALVALRLDEEGYGWTVQLVGRSLAHPVLRVVESTSRFRARTGGRSKVSGRLGPSVRAAGAMSRQAWTASRRRGLLVLMAKAPRSGHSKTRLEAALGAEATATFWTACLGDAGDQLRRIAARADLDVAAMAPTPDDAALVRRLTGLPTLAQRDPGLGRALLEVSELDAPFTIAVSADVPTLPADLVVRAASVMRDRPAVLGPGHDGGYYLVGLRRGVDRLARRRAFLDVPMGTGTVLAHTRSALGDPLLLQPWPDVDTVEELDQLQRELDRDPSAAPRLAVWSAAHSMRTPERGRGVPIGVSGDQQSLASYEQ
ncbi:MAG: DUF2064 domain-containing protein [Candidatus Dormibacteraeota bacterium]|nr:DUF2064 domain-containing protein [Candidatus Dormibacteraeota bacterium]